MFHRARRAMGNAAQLLTSPALGLQSQRSEDQNRMSNCNSNCNSKSNNTTKCMLMTALRIKIENQQALDTAQRYGFPKLSSIREPSLVHASGAVFRSVLEDILERSDTPYGTLSKTASPRGALGWAADRLGRLATTARTTFGRINSEATRAASAAQKRAREAREYLSKYRKEVAGGGGVGGVGAGAALLTPELAETLSQTARSGYVYGRRALRLDNAVDEVNGDGKPYGQVRREGR